MHILIIEFNWQSCTKLYTDSVKSYLHIYAYTCIIEFVENVWFHTIKVSVTNEFSKIRNAEYSNVGGENVCQRLCGETLKLHLSTLE